MDATEYKDHLAAIKAIYSGRRKFEQVLRDYHLKIQEEEANGLRDGSDSEAHRAWETDKYMWDQFVAAKEGPFPWADPAPPKDKVTGKKKLQATANYKSANYPAITVNVQCGCQKNASKASYAATVSSTAIVKTKNNSRYNYYNDDEYREDEE